MRGFTPLILIAVSLAAFFFYVHPQYQKIQAYRTEASQYDEVLTKAAELKRIRAELSSKYSTFSPSDLDRLGKLIPEKVDIARLILDLNGVASRYAIEIKNISTSEATQKESSIGKSKPYRVSTISFDFETSYEGMLRFVADLEQSLRLVDVLSLSLKPGTNPTSPIYTYSITLQTYWLNPAVTSPLNQTQ